MDSRRISLAILKEPICPPNKRTRIVSLIPSCEYVKPKIIQKANITKQSWREILTSVRLRVVLITFIGMVMINSPRFILPIALTCMIPPMNGNTSLNTTSTDDSFEFDWDSDVVDLILMASYFTMWLSPVLGELLRSKVDSKLSTIICQGASTTLLFLTPVAARISPYIVVVIFILQGCFMMANISVNASTAAWWLPRDEKITALTVMFSGFSVSGIVCSVVSGFACLIPIDHGWPFIFYIFGGISVLFMVQWLQIYANSPEEHTYIKKKERNYIIAHRPGMDHATRSDKPPYRVILTSRPVWGLYTSGCCHIWVLFISYLYMPMYFRSVLGFSVVEIGSLVSVIALLRLCCNFLWACVATWLSIKGFSTNFVRKFCIFIGMTVGGSLLILAAAVSTTEDRWTVVALMTSGFCCQSCGASTYTVLPLDMAPRYASIISAMFTSISTLLAISGPPVIRLLTPTNAVYEWQNVWYMMGSLLIASALLMLILGDASLQPWAIGPPRSDSTNSNRLQSIELYRQGASQSDTKTMTKATPAVKDKLEDTDSIEEIVFTQGSWKKSTTSLTKTSDRTPRGSKTSFKIC